MKILKIFTSWSFVRIKRKILDKIFSTSLENESYSIMSDSLWPHGYTIHGILQASILEWVAVLFSKVSSQPMYQTQVSHIADRFFTSWATREAQCELQDMKMINGDDDEKDNDSHLWWYQWWGPLKGHREFSKEKRNWTILKIEEYDQVYILK